MNDVERALHYFQQGCNCAQAVFAAYGPDFGLTADQCLQLAAAFGGGYARRAEECGAVTGALMLLGLKYARSPIGDADAKAEMYALAQQFIAAFTARHGSIRCKDLLGHDLSTPEGQRIAKEQRLSHTLCPHFVQTAAELFEEFSV